MPETANESHPAIKLDPKPYPPLPPDNLARRLTIANADDQPHIGLVGDTYTVLVPGEHTAGHFCVIDMHIPQGGGPGLHRHDFEETFIVLGGEIELTFRGEKITAHTGDTVNIPSNAPHMFHNLSEEPAHLLCICAPAMQEKFFAEVGTPVATRTTPPPAKTDAQQRQFLENMRGLAPRYRTEAL